MLSEQRKQKQISIPYGKRIALIHMVNGMEIESDQSIRISFE